MEFKPVVFNEGAPLDPSKLNELQGNITKVLAENDKLVSSMQQQGAITIVSDYGQDYVTAKAGQVVTKDITPDPSVSKLGTKDNPVRFFVTMRSTPAAGMQVTFSAVPLSDGSGAKIHVSSNKDAKIWFNWYAVIKK